MRVVFFCTVMVVLIVVLVGFKNNFELYHLYVYMINIEFIN